MKRYFFDRTNGRTDLDQEGIELPNIEVARAEAIIFAGGLVQENTDLLAFGQELRVSVRDTNHIVLFSVVVSTSDVAVAAHDQKQS